MNIFWLDHDLEKAARYHVDKHASKMVLEYAQLLSAAHHVLGSDTAPHVYKLSHVNHPCAVWTRSSATAYELVYDMFRLTAREYHYRYCRKHKSWVELSSLLSNNPCPIVSTEQPPQCMPDEYKASCHVEGYRNYYMGDKRAMARWSKRSKPEWWV